MVRKLSQFQPASSNEFSEAANEAERRVREAELQSIAQLKRQKEASKSIRQGTSQEVSPQIRSPVSIDGVKSGDVKARVRASERRATSESPVCENYSSDVILLITVWL